MRRLATWVATLGPVGWFPFAPATLASALVALAAYFLRPLQPIADAAILVALAAVGVWICGVAETKLGHDAHPIVFDEVVGQSLALVLVPRHPLAYAAGFVLFRVFDVWKPLGANQAQALPGGLGVVADDVIAGITACGVFHLLHWGAHQFGIAPF